MDATMANPKKHLKRSGTKKPHSWLWDSHISPKNSKWLAENLEVMDNNVKRMLKLLEEDADSFIQKAQMWLQKQPELIALVEESYRMYRSLAERYDNVTGELRRNSALDLQSQGSGVSDISVENSPSTSREQKPSCSKSGPRAAGFDVFLRSAGNSTDAQHKEEDNASSLTESGSDSDSDDSSINNYQGWMENGADQGLTTQKIADLEMELREVKEKLFLQHEGSLNDENCFDVHEKIAAYERDLKEANERIRASEEETDRLKTELQSYKSSGPSDGTEAEDPNRTILILKEELGIAKAKLDDAEKENADLKNEFEKHKVSNEKLRDLQDQVESAKREAAAWKNKLNMEKREVSKLQERIAMLKTSLQDRDYEIRDLKIAVSDAEQKIFPEKAQIKAEMSKLVEERSRVEEQLKELESRGRSLEDDIRRIANEKAEMEERLKSEIEELKSEIAERSRLIEELSGSVNALRIEKDGMSAEVVVLRGEVSLRDEKIGEMEKHLEELHMEHVKLIMGAEAGRKQMEELRGRRKELEEEVERQRVAILEGAEEKREAIRQLCFSLEHYRNGYLSLRKAMTGHRGVAVLAS